MAARSLTVLVASCLLISSISNLVSPEGEVLKSNNFKLIPSTMLLQDVHLFPRLGFGTAGLFDKTYDVVSTAIQSGFKMIDTAQAQEWYDEEGVGDAVKQYNATSITVVTKVHPRSFEYTKMLTACKQSIVNLLDKSNLIINENIGNTDESVSKENTVYHSLDVVLLHSTHCWPGHCTKEEDAVSWYTGWLSLQQMKHHGLVKYIGVSNFDVKLLQELQSRADIKVAVVQNWMDPFHQDKQVREYCNQHGIVYMAYSSFGTQWSHFKTPNPITGIPEFSNPVFSSAVLKRIGEKHGLSIAQVVISWLLQCNVVGIPRSSKPEHIKELTIFFHTNTDDTTTATDQTDSKFRVFLDDEDMKLIDSLDGTIPLPW